MTGQPRFRVGIDVGGTHTDAAVLDDEGKVVAKAKVATTADPQSGIVDALSHLLADGVCAVENVTHVMLGATHAANAVVERKNLCRVAALRIGAPSSVGLPPFSGWPDRLREEVEAGNAIVGGGSQFDGSPIGALDKDGIRRFAERMAGKAEAFAVSSIYSPVMDEHEHVARELLQSALGNTPVSISSEIGTLGLLERENATILNSALLRAGTHLIEGLRRALDSFGLDARTLFAQNDGTLMSLDHAQRFPVLTIGSGPANSVRGAAYLSGIRNGLVIDIGGTTSDIGVIVDDYPRESTDPVEIGGIRTNFRMVDIVSVGVGGGSVVSSHDGEVKVGPESVGHQLTDEALVFGGDVPTLTDAAVAAGLADVGRRSRKATALLREGLTVAHQLLEEAIDRAKHVGSDQELVAVGGGSILLPSTLKGVSSLCRPEHFEVASAVGAAIGHVSGQVDRVVHLTAETRTRVLDEVRTEAVERAIRAGALPSTTRVIELEEIPLAYLDGGARRVRAKATGPIGRG